MNDDEGLPVFGIGGKFRIRESWLRANDPNRELREALLKCRKPRRGAPYSKWRRDHFALAISLMEKFPQAPQRLIAKILLEKFPGATRPTVCNWLSKIKRKASFPSKR